MYVSIFLPWQLALSFRTPPVRCLCATPPIQFPAFFNGLKSAFQVAEGGNMNDLAQALKDTLVFPDPSLQINFLANHDLPRFRSVVAADSIAFNAVVAQFLFPGFPVTYYGQYLHCYAFLSTVLLIRGLLHHTLLGEEQEIATGLADPDNRQALWGSGMGGYSTETNTYKRIRYLNAIRKFLMSEKATPDDDGKSYLADQGRVVLSTKTDLVFSRGPVLVVLNNVGCQYSGRKYTYADACSGFTASLRRLRNYSGRFLIKLQWGPSGVSRPVPYRNASH
jgi:alpha-amylase